MRMIQQPLRGYCIIFSRIGKQKIIPGENQNVNRKSKTRKVNFVFIISDNNDTIQAV